MRIGLLKEVSVYDKSVADSYLNEAEAAPRWQFRYDNYENDPSPDILLLGAYRHPNTGNALIGGINLKYLNVSQIDTLTRFLPQIMAGDDLQSRYEIGARYMPQLFDQYYRTYDSKYIRGVRKDAIYPKLRYPERVQRWAKDKIDDVQEPQQSQLTQDPQYPDDLERMQKKLDQTVAQLQQATKDEPIDVIQNTPELRAAADVAQDKARQKAKQSIGIDSDDEALKQNIETPEAQAADARDLESPQQAPVQPERSPSIAEPPGEEEQDASQLAQAVQQEIEDSEEELSATQPDNSLDVDLEPGDDLPEHFVNEMRPIIESMIYQGLGINDISDHLINLNVDHRFCELDGEHMIITPLDQKACLISDSIDMPLLIIPKPDWI